MFPLFWLSCESRIFVFSIILTSFSPKRRRRVSFDSWRQGSQYWLHLWHSGGSIRTDNMWCGCASFLLSWKDDDFSTSRGNECEGCCSFYMSVEIIFFFASPPQFASLGPIISRSKHICISIRNDSMLYLCIRSFIARTLRLSISRCYNFYFAKPLSSVTFVIVIEFTAFSFDGTSSAASGINVPVLKSAFRSFSIAACAIFSGRSARALILVWTRL